MLHDFDSHHTLKSQLCFVPRFYSGKNQNLNCPAEPVLFPQRAIRPIAHAASTCARLNMFFDPHQLMWGSAIFSDSQFTLASHVIFISKLITPGFL
jgi:hypothetical protein